MILFLLCCVCFYVGAVKTHDVVRDFSMVCERTVTVKKMMTMNVKVKRKSTLLLSEKLRSFSCPHALMLISFSLQSNKTSKPSFIACPVFHHSI